MIEEGKDVVDYQEIKVMSTGILCPECNSSHVIKNGLQSGYKITDVKTAADSSELPLVPLCMAFIKRAKCSNISNV